MPSDNHEGFGFSFDAGACHRCRGFCCRGESGNIWVTPTELETICAFLRIHPIDGMERHFVKKGNRFSIRERDAGDEFWCVFLDAGGGCSIYAVRPSQCRTFPFWERFRGRPHDAAGECPGVIIETPE